MKNKSIFIAFWIIIIAGFGIQIILGISESDSVMRIASPLLIVYIALFAAIHGTIRYGKKNMLIFFLITFIVSWGYENLSIITGFPFGKYHYTDFLGFKLLYVPLVIMPAYFGTAYLSWTIAQVLLDEFKKKLSGGSIFFVPFIASFIMVMWDLVMDTYASTISHAWNWESGGGFFGVPFSNFMGWFLCVFTIYLIFAIYLKKNGDFTSHLIVSEKLYWIQAAIVYSQITLFVLFRAFFEESSIITTLDNHQWWTGDLYETASLMWVFTMFFVASLATIKTISNEDLRHNFLATDK